MQNDKKIPGQDTGKEEKKTKPVAKKKAATTATPAAPVSNADTSAAPVKKATGTAKPASPAKPANAPAEKAIAKPAVKATKEAIATTGGEAKAAKSTAAKPAAKKSNSPTKVYGQITLSGNGVVIEKGSIPEGQVQLTAQNSNQALTTRLSAYNGLFVTILGEAGKKSKEGKFTSFTVQQIASHDEIARRAYELSQGAPNSDQDNWLKAENELLSAK